ncbi:MAG TPA: hypothetical protein VFG76_04575, partial [Candidatus Polarisedimenticolia bacterium]|nr:hypothetical protein [Candidatus Polarisedimenticolia bacterium]
MTSHLATAGVLLALMGSTASGAPAPPARHHLRIQTDVSPTTNLIHWVDNLAGTSAGKTMPVYQRYWRDRFGPHDQSDTSALQAFARIRRLQVPVARGTALNESGCLPVPPEVPGWHQIFMTQAMSARSIQGFTESLSDQLSPADRQDLASALERFRPRFEKVWPALGHVRRFEGRFKRFLRKGELPDYLSDVAELLDVDAGAAPPVTISLVGLPLDGPTHAEADGAHLLIEIRPEDSPEDQIPVVSHEASHYLMAQWTTSQVDRLAAQAFAEGAAGGLLWRYLWEGLPTALGQGLAERRLREEAFSLSAPWYHIDAIDRFAKLIYPQVAQASEKSMHLED